MKVFYKTAPPETKIRIVKTTAMPVMDKLHNQILELARLWSQAPDEFRQKFIDNSIFNSGGRPFLEFEDAAKNSWLTDAKSNEQSDFS